MIQEAEAYKERLVNEADGEAQRFLSVYNAYKQNPDVTRRRIYLETIQKVCRTRQGDHGQPRRGRGALPAARRAARRRSPAPASPQQ